MAGYLPARVVANHLPLMPGVHRAATRLGTRGRGYQHSVKPGRITVAGKLGMDVPTGALNNYAKASRSQAVEGASTWNTWWLSKKARQATVHTFRTYLVALP